MSGTESPLLVLLASGESMTKVMRFLPGQPTQPITIGREGTWRIDAAGVAPTHLRLAFDGRQIHVCTLGERCPAAINGAPIDARWWPVQAPCEIMFGGACLRIIAEQQAVTPAPRPDATELHVAPGPAKPNPMAGTVLDGSGRWFAERGPGQRAPEVKAPSGPPGPSAPPPRAPLAPPVAETRVSAAPAKAEPPTVAAMPPAGGTPAPARATAGRNDMTVVASRDPEPAPARGPVRTPFLGLEGVRGGPTPTPAPYNPAPDFAARGGSGSVSPPPGLRTPPPQWDERKDPGHELPPAPSKKSGLNLWSGTSPVMKAIMVLLPIGAGLAFKVGLFDEDAPAVTAPSRPATTNSALAASPPRPIAESAAPVKPPPTAAQPTSAPTRPTPTAGASDPTPVASAAGSARAPEPAHSAAAASPADAPAKRSGAQTRTQQRDAIDAAFSGNFEDAVALYDQLAQSQPNEPAFREAARILREKSQRAH